MCLLFGSSFSYKVEIKRLPSEVCFSKVKCVWEYTRVTVLRVSIHVWKYVYMHIVYVTYMISRYQLLYVVTRGKCLLT